MRIHSTIMTKRKSKCFENIRNAIFLSPVFVDVFVRLINYSKLLGKWSKNNLVWKSPWYGYMYYIPGYMYICSWITLNDLVNTHLDLSGLNQGGGGGKFIVLTPWSTIFGVRESRCMETCSVNQWLKCTPWYLNYQNPRMFRLGHWRSIE